MKVLGIVAEYNPFHNGHLYQINRAKQLTGADYVVAIMSGNFTQRGEAAFIDKYTRTKMALNCGVDLVIELPVCYATASAEYFALASIAHLNHSGIIDYLCFGSECGDIAVLQSIANILQNEPESYQNNLKKYLRQGLSFPSARSRALTDYLSICPEPLLSDAAEIIKNPNNILGIEYLKALNTLNSSIIPVTVERVSTGYHDKSITRPISSATAIRHHTFTTGSLHTIRCNIPAPAYDILSSADISPLCNNDFSLPLGYQLMKENNYQQFMDINGDLEDRLINLRGSFCGFEQFSGLLCSRLYTATRINRVLLHILLNITKELHQQFEASGYCNYLRILGFRQDADILLKHIKNHSPLPLITKMSAAKNIRLLDADIHAANIYNLVRQYKDKQTLPNEYNHGLVIV